jgi:hypothetical protein
MSLSFYESFGSRIIPACGGQSKPCRRRQPFAFAVEIFPLWSALFSMFRSAE